MPKFCITPKDKGMKILISSVQRIIATIFLLIGLVVLGCGIYMALIPAIPAEFTGTTQATITDIERSRSSSNTSSSEHYDVFIEYEVDGQSYNGKLGYYSTGMTIGQQVEIQFDTRDPSKISSPSGRFFGMIICLILGAAFTIVGVFLQFKEVPVTFNAGHGSGRRRRIR